MVNTLHSMINITVIQALSEARLKVRYRGSLTGLLWVLFQPVTLFVVQLLVFRHLLPVEKIDYAYFLATGFFPWFALQQSVLMGTGTFLAYARSIQSLTLHPINYISAVIVDTSLSFILSFFLTIATLCMLWGFIGLKAIVLLGLSCVPFILCTFLLTWLCAIVQVFLRDTGFVVGFLLNVLFITSPVLYHAELLPDSYRMWLQWNPLSILIGPFRAAVGAYQGYSFMHLFGIATILCGLIGLPTIVIWKKYRHALIAKL